MGFLQRTALIVTLAAAGASSACGQYRPPRAYEVTGGAPTRAYEATIELAKSNKYRIAERNDANRELELVAHIDESTSHKSFIRVRVAEDGKVTLKPAGHLVRKDGSTHKRLRSEIAAFESALKARLGDTGGAASAPSASLARADASSEAVPRAWAEPAYDPAVWGPGEFTCVPVRVPSEDAPLLKLRLSNGEEADVALSIAYAPELCRSPKQCSVPGGCPALGVGDSGQVARLAERIQKHEVASEATLLDRGKPIAIIDLARHGSIRQALGQHPSK